MGKLKILLILIVVLVVSSAINQSVTKTEKSKKTMGDKSLEKLAKPTPTASPTPTKIPVQTNNQTDQTTQSPNNPNSQNIEYVYPGATVIKTEGGTIFLESSADPGAITNWYVQQVQNAGFSAKSTVRTNTNGNVLNKISASGNNQEVNIEIKKSPNSSTTEIKVIIGS